MWPVKGHYEISSPYGKRISPITGNESFHYGIDIPANEGSELISLLAGKVIFADFNKLGYGNTIIIKGEEYMLIYSHVSSDFLVMKGMDVNVGDVIGHVGGKYIKKDGKYIENGKTTGSHLHFEVLKKGINIDPIDYILELELKKENEEIEELEELETEELEIEDLDTAYKEDLDIN